jgi:protein-S-isoprenylcysteine O-methyltransferase Ste14
VRNPIRLAIIEGISSLIVFAALMYFAAGTWNYWQGWLFLAVFAALTAGSTIYIALHDRPLLERRLAAGPWQEKERSQQVIVTVIILAFFASIILPALDHRFGFSPVPGYVAMLGEALTVFSFLAMFWVIKTNSWAAANVSVARDQRVVDTGPYAYVRHPMYAFAIWLFVGIPLALGSWWSIALVVAVIPVLIRRLIDEERILQRDLPGYTDYMKRVPYRLIPYVW